MNPLKKQNTTETCEKLDRSNIHVKSLFIRGKKYKKDMKNKKTKEVYSIERERSREQIEVTLKNWVLKYYLYSFLTYIKFDCVSVCITTVYSYHSAAILCKEVKKMPKSNCT